MTLEEYKIKMKELEEEFQQKKRVLIKQYALANNTVKIGDIIEDHIGKILVKSIKIFVDLRKPQCMYEGVVLLKSGKPSKKGTTRNILQENLAYK